MSSAQPYPLKPNPQIPAQIVAIGAAHAESAAFSSQTYAVRLVATSACHVRVGRTPVAVATDMLIAANQYGELIGVAPGDKISVIQDAAGGNLSIQEMTR